MLNVGQLKNIGKEWIAGDKHRIYFDVKQLYQKVFQFEVGFYKTGNVSWAKINGEDMSNRKAAELLFSLGNAKLFYDVKAGKFVSERLGDENTDALVNEIKNSIDGQ